MPVRNKARHRTARIGWLRAAVLGANDGILSTSSLVLGVAAAHATHSNGKTACAWGYVSLTPSDALMSPRRGLHTKTDALARAGVRRQFRRGYQTFRLRLSGREDCLSGHTLGKQAGVGSRIFHREKKM